MVGGSTLQKCMRTFIPVLLLAAALFVGGSASAQGLSVKLGGGPVLGTISPNLDALNNSLAANGFAPLSPSLIQVGLSGHGGLRPGWNVALLGSTASTRSRNGAKEARLGLSFIGAAAEYALPTASRLEISVGFQLGYGNASLSLIHARPVTTEEGVESPADTVFQSSFFAIGPRVGAEIPIKDWMGIRASAGYWWALGTPRWRHGGDTMGGIPADLSAPSFEIELYFGGRLF